MLTALSLAASLWALSQSAGERAVQPRMVCHGSGDTTVCVIPDGGPALVGGDAASSANIFEARDQGLLCDVTSIGCVEGPGIKVPVERVIDDFGKDLYWLIGSNAADLYSTAWAIHRCDGACGEGNPLGPTVEARLALKMASMASTGLTLWKLRRDGHGRAATIVRWASVAVNSALVANNVRHAIRRR